MTAITLPVAVEAPQHSGLTGALHYSSPQALPPAAPQAIDFMAQDD